MSDPITVRPIEILLVEDNPGDVRLTLEALKEGKLANHVTVAADGEEALARLRRDVPHREAVPPDLVLLDLNLPKLSGREVLETVRADPLMTDLPIVLLTMSREESNALEAIHLGATAYLTKPLGASDLIGLTAEIEVFHLTVVVAGISP